MPLYLSNLSNFWSVPWYTIVSFTLLSGKIFSIYPAYNVIACSFCRSLGFVVPIIQIILYILLASFLSKSNNSITENFVWLFGFILSNFLSDTENLSGSILIDSWWDLILIPW